VREETRKLLLQRAVEWDGVLMQILAKALEKSETPRQLAEYMKVAFETAGSACDALTNTAKFLEEKIPIPVPPAKQGSSG